MGQKQLLFGEHWLARMYVVGVDLPPRHLVKITEYQAVLADMGVPAAQTPRAGSKAVYEALLRRAVEEAALGTVGLVAARSAAAVAAALPGRGPVVVHVVVSAPPTSAGPAQPHTHHVTPLTRRDIRSSRCFTSKSEGDLANKP